MFRQSASFHIILYPFWNCILRNSELISRGGILRERSWVEGEITREEHMCNGERVTCKSKRVYETLDVLFWY